jgi:hypothetical protein
MQPGSRNHDPQRSRAKKTHDVGPGGVKKLLGAAAADGFVTRCQPLPEQHCCAGAAAAESVQQRGAPVEGPGENGQLRRKWECGHRRHGFHFLKLAGWHTRAQGADGTGESRTLEVPGDDSEDGMIHRKVVHQNDGSGVEQGVEITNGHAVLAERGYRLPRVLPPYPSCPGGRRGSAPCGERGWGLEITTWGAISPVHWREVNSIVGGSLERGE